MVDFDRLNRETHEYNCNNVNRFNPAAPNTNKSSFNYFQYLNNQTFKENNGQYNPKFY